MIFVAVKKTLESSLDSKIKPVNPKGNQPWIFIGRTDAEAEALILWSPDGMSWFIGEGKKTLMLRMIESRTKRDWQMMRWLNDITHSMDMNLGKLWKIVKDREVWHAEVHRVSKNQTGLWLNKNKIHCYPSLDWESKTVVALTTNI